MRRRQFLLSTLALAFATRASAQALRPWNGIATPQIELDDVDGKAYRLADFRGKVVLVNFWATWCEPCREEMPSIERLRKSLEGKRFAVLAVNVGEGPNAVREFTKKVPLGATILLDRDISTSRAWGARLLPATFIVGPDGAVRYLHYGALDWSREDIRATIAKLLE
jgi:thiol-disulfide isomerase/thioredoxin